VLSILVAWRATLHRSAPLHPAPGIRTPAAHRYDKNGDQQYLGAEQTP
jgi:hypothetical protein